MKKDLAMKIEASVLKKVKRLAKKSRRTVKAEVAVLLLKGMGDNGIAKDAHGNTESDIHLDA